MLILVVLHGVDDGDHHNEIVAVLAKVGQHVSYHDEPVFDHVPAGQKQARQQHQQITGHGDQRHDAHQLFPANLAGDGRIAHHQDGGGGHAHRGEQGVQAALIAEIKVDIGGTDAAHHKAIADLLNQKDQRDPHQLVVAGDGGENLLETDGRYFLRGFDPAFLNTEDGAAQKQRRENAHHQCNASEGHIGAAADGQATGGEHGNEHRGRRAADACKQRRPGGELVALIRVGTESGHHAPVGNIVHGIGNAVEQIDHTEEPHEIPALQIGIEGQIHHH